MGSSLDGLLALERGLNFAFGVAVAGAFLLIPSEYLITFAAADGRHRPGSPQGFASDNRQLALS